jgi:hypothetical protein
MQFKIDTDLDEFEADTLVDLLKDYISENREMARYRHVVGEVTQAELDWHLSHADYVEGIAKKLFPKWAMKE